MPGPVLDAQIVRRASRATWGPLLEAGVRIYESQPTMYHTKVMVVDDIWGLGGLHQLRRPLVPAQRRGQPSTCSTRRSREVTLQEWRRRSLWERVQERWATLFRSQL